METVRNDSVRQTDMIPIFTVSQLAFGGDANISIMVSTLVLYHGFFQKKGENSKGREQKGKEYEDEGTETAEKALDRSSCRGSSTTAEERPQAIKKGVVPRGPACQSLIIHMAPATETGEEVRTIEVKDTAKQ